MLNRMNDLLAIAMDVEGIEREMDEAKGKASAKPLDAGESAETVSSTTNSASDSSQSSKKVAPKSSEETVGSV